MKKKIFFCLTFLLLLTSIVFSQEHWEECTVGVATGKATNDGRPIMWKNRDTTVLDNEINYFTDGRFKYMALVSAGYPLLAWAGTNEMGFCIMNSASNDQKGHSKTGLGNGAIMKEALQNCVTVNDFEILLIKTNVAGRTTFSNFGVIDAFGGAAIFETGNHSFTKFDANDSDTAPMGYIIRSNFTRTGGGDGGMIRYKRGEHLWKEAATKNKLSYRNILRSICRDLSDEHGKPYTLPVKGKKVDHPRGTINTFSTINRFSTASTALFHGVKSNENPSFTTFWAILGEPIFSIAVPNWVISEGPAPELDGERFSPLCTSVLKIKQGNYYDFGRKKRYLITDNLKKIWSLTFPAEDLIFDQTDNILTAWRQNYPKAEDVLDFHRSMASLAMSTIQKVERGFSVSNNIVRVGVFADFGTSEICIREALDALNIDPDMEPVRITGPDIANGILDGLDAVVFPGGSGSRQASSLGVRGRSKVTEFINNGGGFLGLCAGAYLGSDHPGYDWCLHMADARVLDREHYARGEGLVEVKLTEKGKGFLPELGGKSAFFSYYHDGPLLAPGRNPHIQDYETLAVFQSDVHTENDTPSGIMPGSTFLLRAQKGKGKVVLCAGHPESTPGLRWLVPKSVRWTAGRKAIDYLPYFVKPEKFNREILFDQEWLKKESILLKKLVAKDRSAKLDAMKELAEMGSRKFPRWLKGLLRDSELAVRRAAAKFIGDLDYFMATDDLKQAIEDEKDEQTKQLFQHVLDKLRVDDP
ncbi:MAG: hypothetical protein E3J56_04790 [Candidatus Aminicenantes bacterium]|nr:MAG: hypothetical protein E3J56_04790 [Candidatus Aminicenantes bacterium]